MYICRRLYDPFSSEQITGGIFDIKPCLDRKAIESSSLLLIVQVICSNIKHLRCPRTKIAAMLLLVRFGRCCDDDVILQRVLPFIMTFLEDPIASIRATAVRTVKALLGIVHSFTSLESNLFQFYIFPALNRIAKDSDAIVRIAFAESIGSFAETAKRFLVTLLFCVS